MEFIKSFSDYNTENSGWSRPEFYYNEATKCLKIGTTYLFLEKEMVLEEGDEKLNELFGFNLSNLLPKTPSDWIHLGVDGVSAIVSAIPGAGKLVSMFIDLIHAGAYFFESRHASPNESFGLVMGGVITATFALTPTIGGSAIGGYLKNILNKIVRSTIGKFVKFLLKYTIGLPLVVSRFLFKKIFAMRFLKEGILRFVLKNEDSWIFKTLYKIPGIKQIIDFFKNDLGIILNNAEKYLVKDLQLYKKAISAELNNTYKTSYKTLDKSVQALITEEQFVKAAAAQSEKHLSQLELGTLAKNPNILLNDGKGFAKEVAEKVMANTKTSILNISANLDKYMLSKYPKLSKWIAADVKKSVGELVVKGEKNVGEEAYEAVIAAAVKRLPKEVLKKFSVALLKRFGINSIKNDIVNNERELDAEAAAKVETPTEEPKVAEPVQPQEQEIVKNDVVDKQDEFKQKYHLKIADVDSVDQLGKMILTFKTPDKEGEEARLILEGDVFEATDLSNTLSLYPTEESLLADLKTVGKKNDDKERLRERETKKWETSQQLSTPMIKSENARYEFHFLIRERSKISFFKKSHVEEVSLADMITREYTELNKSLYVIVKKVTE